MAWSGLSGPVASSSRQMEFGRHGGHRYRRYRDATCCHTIKLSHETITQVEPTTVSQPRWVELVAKGDSGVSDPASRIGVLDLRGGTRQCNVY